MTTLTRAAASAPAATTEQRLNGLLLRKLMPLLIVVYVMSFLDRTNIALAKASMGIDLGLSAAAYGLGAGLFFLTYALAEVPSNLIMHRVGARFWITRIMITWGLLSAGMVFVQGETSFYIMRLLLGVAEAGLFPGVMLYLTYWFDREQRARATGYFLLGVCLANILSGPLGGALLEMDGVLGWHGWQWLFVLEGLPAVALALVVWKKLPDGPASAPWLSAADAKAIERRLAAERAAAPQQSKLGQMFRDRQIWLAIVVYFVHQITIYTVIFFLPGIIGTYAALSPFQVGLLTAVPWVAAAIGAATFPRLATSPRRCRTLLFSGLLTMAAGLLLASLANSFVGLIGVLPDGADAVRGAIDHLRLPLQPPERQCAGGRPGLRYHLWPVWRLRRAFGNGAHRADHRQHPQWFVDHCCVAGSGGTGQHPPAPGAGAILSNTHACTACKRSLVLHLQALRSQCERRARRRQPCSSARAKRSTAWRRSSGSPPGHINARYCG